jgi:hypothetical protein
MVPIYQRKGEAGSSAFPHFLMESGGVRGNP